MSNLARRWLGGTRFDLRVTTPMHARIYRWTYLSYWLGKIGHALPLSTIHAVMKPKYKCSDAVL